MKESWSNVREQLSAAKRFFKRRWLAVLVLSALNVFTFIAGLIGDDLLEEWREETALETPPEQLPPPLPEQQPIGPPEEAAAEGIEQEIAEAPNLPIYRETAAFQHQPPPGWNINRGLYAEDIRTCSTSQYMGQARLSIHRMGLFYYRHVLVAYWLQIDTTEFRGYDGGVGVVLRTQDRHEMYQTHLTLGMIHNQRLEAFLTVPMVEALKLGVISEVHVFQAREDMDFSRLAPFELEGSKSAISKLSNCSQI